MNFKIKIFAYLMLAYALPCGAQMGCMDTSWHLDQPFDNKALHPVDCTCPCQDYETDLNRPFTKNRCPRCGHIRIPERSVILNKKDVANAAAPQTQSKKSPLQNIYASMARVRITYK